LTTFIRWNYLILSRSNVHNIYVEKIVKIWKKINYLIWIIYLKCLNQIKKHFVNIFGSNKIRSGGINVHAQIIPTDVKNFLSVSLATFASEQPASSASRATFTSEKCHDWQRLEFHSFYKRRGESEALATMWDVAQDISRTVILPTRRMHYSRVHQPKLLHPSKKCATRTAGIISNGMLSRCCREPIHLLFAG